MMNLLLTSRGAGFTTGISLTATAVWRLGLGVVMMDNTPALALTVKYPSDRSEDGTATVSLLRVPVPVAQSVEEVRRIANVSLQPGNLDEDLARMEEAYALFRNNPRVPSQDSLSDAITRGQGLVTAYWRTSDWILSDSEETLRVDNIIGQVMVGMRS